MIVQYIPHFFQISLILLFLFSIRKKKTNEIIFERSTVTSLKGIFALIIMLFHMPIDWHYAFLGQATHFIIVTMFCTFSGYGLTISLEKRPEYIKTLPKKITHLAIFYMIVKVGIFSLTYDNRWGAEDWMILALVNYIVVWVVYSIAKENMRSWIDISFWVIASVLLQLTDCGIFHVWSAQVLGFAYGVILARGGHCVLQKLQGRIKWITIAALSLCFFGEIYVYLMTDDTSIVNNTTYLLRVIISLTVVVLYVILFAGMSLYSQIASYLGRISLYIYMLHRLAILAVSRAFPDLIKMILIITCTLMVSMILDRINRIVGSRMSMLKPL